MDKRTREVIERLEARLFRYQNLLNSPPEAIIDAIRPGSDPSKIPPNEDLALIIRKILEHLRRKAEQDSP